MTQRRIYIGTQGPILYDDEQNVNDDTFPGEHMKALLTDGKIRADVSRCVGELLHPQTPKTHKSSHESEGSDEVSVEGLSGELKDMQLPKIVDRGDPSSWDWTLSSFTTDGSWHDLDCSSIVPAGARLIIFLAQVWDAAVPNQEFKLRKKGNTYAINIGYWNTIAGAAVPSDAMVFCDVDRVVEYWATNATFDGINLAIKGWIF